MASETATSARRAIQPVGKAQRTAYPLAPSAYRPQSPVQPSECVDREPAGEKDGTVAIDIVLRLSREQGSADTASRKTAGAGGPERELLVARLLTHEGAVRQARQIARGLAAQPPSPVECDGDAALRLALIARLLGMAAAAPSEPAPTGTVRALPKWRLRRVLDHIDAHIAGPITLADLAAVAGISRMYFASQFRAATGMRPHECVLRKRIEHAQRLLVATTGSLVDIAGDVGFQTQAHFTTVFKRFVGDTPNRWRHRQIRLVG